jgi:hypothetical protein
LLLFFPGKRKDELVKSRWGNPVVIPVQAGSGYFSGSGIPACETVSQIQSNILQVYVIPGLTRNPVVFLSVTTRDAGSGSGMTG